MNARSPVAADHHAVSLLWETLFASGDLGSWDMDDAARFACVLEAAFAQEPASDAWQGRVSREQVETLLVPLTVAVLQLAKAAQRRVLVGITGGAGTGKTVLSDWIRRAVDILSQREIAVTLGADAYHFPNRYLDTQTTITNGTEHPLRQLKGLPHTFDVHAFAADLQRLRSAALSTIHLPVYDRGRHDPVPDALCVRPQHDIVIVEGLHLLRPEPEWKAARKCLDFCILLEMPLATCRRRVTARKISAGRTPADVQAHFERVDRPTLDAVNDPVHRAQADLVIQLDEAQTGHAELQTRVQGCERRVNSDESLALRAIPKESVHLLAVGLNPALQKTLVFDHWERGHVNRAREILVSVGGKGQQFSRAASHLIPGRITLAQFLGGENGDRLGRLLERAGVNQLTVTTSGETRCCLTAIDRSTGEATELIEPSAPIAPAEADQLLSRTLEILQHGKVSGLALCGTCPPGIDAMFYTRLAHAKGSAVLLLDSYRDVQTLLETRLVDILKVNAHELQSLANDTCGTQSLIPDSQPLSVPAAALRLFTAFDLRWLAVTAGSDTAWLFDRPVLHAGPVHHQAWRYYEYRLPALDQVVNPIGAGDTVGAVFLSQLLSGALPHEAFACGLAAGTASCLQLGGADYTLPDLHSVLARMRVSHVMRRWVELEGGPSEQSHAR